MLKGNVRSRVAKLYTAEKSVDVVEEEEEEQRPRRGTWSNRRQRRGLILKVVNVKREGTLLAN
jgi:hypothetical protein